MGSWPFTRLHFGHGRCVAVSGPHIQVFDATSGKILATTRYTNTISCSAVSENYVHLVTTGDDKKLVVWELKDLQLKSSRELPKKATVVQLSHDGKTILVADKFGDVFSYHIDLAMDTIMDPAQSTEPQLKDALASHENPHGSLVLGHASIITSFLLSHDGQYIMTADRDEHIRVSRYPNGYNIEQYCLGHQLFISTICIPTFEPSSLVSGGGDPYMNIWDWMNGTLKCQIPVADTVIPFLKVRGRKNKCYGGLARGRRRGRGTGPKAKEGPEEVEIEIEDSSKSSGEIATAENTSEEGHVFALRKVEAFEFDSEKLLIFSAIGSSALFYCTYPSDPSNIPPVRHIDFSSPVLDFVLGDVCRLLVSVDASWSSALTQKGTTCPAVRLLKWIGGELKLVEEKTPLLTSINGAGSQAASDAELQSLSLYSDLDLLPKNAEGPNGGDGMDEQDSDKRAETPESSQRDRKVQHAKAKGRLKTKQALLRKHLDKDSSLGASGDERESKKIKLDQSQ